MQTQGTNRQESHRVYLQQYTKAQGTKDPSFKTNSTAIRLTSVTNARDVCYLLRQKFGLPSLPQSSSSSSSSQVSNLSSNSSIQNNEKNLSSPQTPLVHRIHARLNQVRQQQQSNNKSIELKKASSTDSSSEEARKKQRRHRRKQRRKKVLECQLNEDVLVMVATCYVPKTYVQFEHEEYSFSQQQGGNSSASHTALKPSNSLDSTATRQGEANNNSSFLIEPLNIVETLLPSEIPLQRMDDLLSYTDRLQDIVEIEVFGKKRTSKKTRKPPLIHWFFIPKHDNQIPKAAINIDGYCTEAFDGSDYDEENDKHENLKREQKKDDSVPSWKNEIIEYNSDKTTHQQQSRLERERHLFKVLSTFEAINSNDNTSGYLLKQSHKDKNVWKKVHCVLTENQFYHVSRVKNFGKNNSTRIGEHGIIDLNGTLLLESMIDSPLSGLPNTFQLTTKEGNVHVFQAGSKSAYTKWSHCLSDRIVLCQEYSSFATTDSIISSEIKSRQKKYEKFLLAPLELLSDDSPMTSSNNGETKSQVNALMTLGLQIAVYKEQCRRVQYAHSSSLLSANHEMAKSSQKRPQKIIEKPLWLNQSLENLTFAELLLTRCKDFSSMLKGGEIGVKDGSLHSRSEAVENEIHQCLNNLRQENEHYLLDYHKASDASKNNEESRQNTILPPEALFDEMFRVFSEMLAS